MMTYQIPTAKAFISKGSPSYSRAAPGYPTYSTFGMGAGRGRAAFRPSEIRKFPLIQPVNRTQNDNASVSSDVIKGTSPCQDLRILFAWCCIGGHCRVSGVLAEGRSVMSRKPSITKEEKVASENFDHGNDIFGRHFLFKKTFADLDRTRTVIPPLRRDNNEHPPAKPHPFSLSNEPHSIHSERPFTLGFHRSYGVNTSPTILFPTTFVVNTRNTFSVESCKLNRSKVHHATYNPVTVKDNQKISLGCLHESQSYSDPMVGAPRSFIHRISKLSSLEGETVRQEKLKKIRKSRKSPS
ncbi:uncharacterized protein C8orf89 homolog isoform 1-T1 [Anableps anableps]